MVEVQRERLDDFGDDGAGTIACDEGQCEST